MVTLDVELYLTFPGKHNQYVWDQLFYKVIFIYIQFKNNFWLFKTPQTMQKFVNWFEDERRKIFNLSVLAASCGADPIPGHEKLPGRLAPTFRGKLRIILDALSLNSLRFIWKCSFAVLLRSRTDNWLSHCIPLQQPVQWPPPLEIGFLETLEFFWANKHTKAQQSWLPNIKVSTDMSEHRDGGL